MKCYVASAFFNDEQICEIENIKKILVDLGIEFFSPKDYFVVKPNAEQAEREKIFRKNLEEIESSDFVIVNTNNRDSGSIFEAGFSCHAKIPIIYFNNQKLKGGFNLMLAQSGISVCSNYDELTLAIKKFIDSGEYKDNFEGEIE